MSIPASPKKAAKSDINDILGRYNIIWCNGDEYRPEPRLVWDYEDDERAPRSDGGILFTLAANDETNPPDPPPQPGTTPITGHLVRENWRAIWTGTYSSTDGLKLRVQSMNEPMKDAIFGSCHLELYSTDDSGYAFVRGEFDVSWRDCGGTYSEWIKILAKRNGPALRLTESERQRCQDFIEKSEEGEEEEEEEEGSGQAVSEPEENTDIIDILGRYNLVWKDESFAGPEGLPWPDHNVTISRCDSAPEAARPGLPIGPGKTSVVAELDHGSWRARWAGTYSEDGGLMVRMEEMNPSMEESIHGRCRLDLYSCDDKGFPFVYCNFDTGFSGCSGTGIELLFKKHGPGLALTKSERGRCKEVVGETEGEGEE